MAQHAAPEPPQFPAGPFAAPDSRDRPALQTWIDDLEQAPARLRGAVAGLSAAQLDITYRNWTIRQIAHHVADSHLHSYARFKLALTEDRPAIKPYDESRWSELADARGAEVETSLRVLDGLHARWTYLLRALPEDAFGRAFYHPETREVVPLWRALAYYVWHGRHHTAQIEWVKRHKIPGRAGRS
jgi:uncharacterized damage-inducible protein DinB